MYWTTIQQILVTGVLSSAVYFLLALGFALVFGVARIINLSHTALYMVAAYLIYTFMYMASLNLILSVTLSVILTTIIGVTTYKLLVERIREHEVTVIIVTLTIALVIQECMLLLFSGRYYGIDSYIPGSFELLGVTIAYQHLLTLLVAIICTGVVSVFLLRTKLGLAIRVTAQDREIANLMGIDVNRMCVISVAIASALSAIAGAFVAPIFVVQPHMWMSPLVLVMAIVVLGGLGSIKGAFIGALILGFAETIVVFLAPNGSFLRESVAMVVMVITLLVRPDGLFGVAFEEERL